jgi:hypothetical protein
MSTLQVANVWFESTSNNRIQYAGSNSYVLVAGGANTFTVNATGVGINGTSAHTGAATFSNTVTVTGNATFSNTVTVTGNATFSNTVTFSSDIVPATSYKRNRIINGNMVIDQRNAGASITINSDSSKFSVDRWYFQGQNSDGVFTVQQSSVAPAGFSKSMLLTVTTADTSIGATQTYFYKQSIEGYNVADLGWGAAGASTVTLSFWVRSSLTGTFSGAINNGAFNRSYPFTFTINAANTWEQKTATITGDTTGTWPTDNSSSLQVYFAVGAGSTYLGTANTWAASGYVGATVQTNLIATNGATFYLTGVQLEVGTKATPYEMQIYSDQLAQCQRYYSTTGISSFSPTSGSIQTSIYYKVEMRAPPTITTTVQTSSNKSSGPTVDTGYGNYSGSSTSYFGYTYTLSAGGYCHSTFTLSAEL